MSQRRREGVKRVVFSVRNMDCATCALAIEKRMKRLDGIASVGSAIMLNKVFVDYDGSRVSVSEIKNAIREAGYSNYVAYDDAGMQAV
jgi:Cu+-exporting ATPase